MGCNKGALMFLFKDNKTNQKSVTVTCLIVTFTLTVVAVIVNIWLLAIGRGVEAGLIWACLGFMAPFAAIYWNKRFRASATGVEFGGQDGSSS